MKKILITGGTVFVSRYVAGYYVNKGYDVYVINRNTHPQIAGVTLIEKDRHALGNDLKEYEFDAVLDITAYTTADIQCLLGALGAVKDYIFVSSSAIYPETLQQPFYEEQQGGYNSIWKEYGINKLHAEEYLLAHFPGAYILRPPYFYGSMENLYREPFVFDCAKRELPFYVPKDGKMPLQFFHVHDLCIFMDILLEQHPEQRIYNVGNCETVTVEDWVQLCYYVVGKTPRIIYTDSKFEQRDYFCFYDYGYELDVSRQNALMSERIPLLEGLKETYQWYLSHENEVKKKPYLDFIETKLSHQL